jgi:hypothetical protein
MSENAYTFLLTLVGLVVKVTPENRKAQRVHVGKLLRVDGDHADPVLVVNVGTSDIRSAWHDVERVQVETTITRK